MAYSKDDYENEPVHYCAVCISLNIKELPKAEFDICGECGNTDIKITDMDTWAHLYTTEYGSVFLTEEDVLEAEEE